MKNILAVACVLQALCVQHSNGASIRYSYVKLDPSSLLGGARPSNDLIQSLAQATGLSQQETQRIVTFWRAKEALHVPTWQPQYSIVSQLIRDNDCKIGCEVGVAFGTQSVHILEHTTVEKLYAIDPFVLYNDGLAKGTTQQWWDILAQLVQDRLMPFHPRCEFIREGSLHVAARFEDRSLDFIYIDADHNYPAVKADLHAWYPKLKPGGLLIGDDYDFYGVKRGVDEFVRDNELTLTLFHGRTYCIRVPRGSSE